MNNDPRFVPDSYTGILLDPRNVTLHRAWFEQMVKLLGIKVQYMAPTEDKEYNQYGELDDSRLEDTQYLEDHFIDVGCIYDEHPTQKTMRKLGWDAEMADASVLIHVPYQIEEKDENGKIIRKLNVEAGGIFRIPVGNDIADTQLDIDQDINDEEVELRKYRYFRVLRMSNIAVYPASITCELGPIYQNVLPKNDVQTFRNSDFNLLDDESEDYE